jgi:O-antigen ligase
VALQGIYQFLFRVGPEAFLLFDRFMRAYGTFAQPNPYGAYLGLTLPVAAGLAIALRLRRGGAREWPLLVLSVVSGVLMAIALVMSWSRGAWLGFAAAVVAMALAMVVRSRWAAPWLAIGLAGAGYLALAGGVAYLPPALVQRFSDLTPFLSVSDVRGVEITDANYAVVERLAHWQAATAMWADRPWLGVGIGNYSVAYPAYALPLWPDPLGHAHNYYLNTGAETGILGLLAYVAFVGVALLLTWREAMRSTGWRWGLVLGALGVLVHLSVHSLFDNLYVHALYLQVAILLGAVASNGREQEPA